MKQISLICFLLFLILSACQNDKNNSNNEEEKKESVLDETIDSEDGNVPFTEIKETDSVNNIDDAFKPPHFKIKNFSINKVENNDVKFIIQYELSANSHKFLVENKAVAYFNILYPESIQQLSGHIGTPLKKLDLVNNESVWSITLKDKFSNDFNIDNLKNTSENFELQLLDKNKRVFHVFEGINLYAAEDGN